MTRPSLLFTILMLVSIGLIGQDITGAWEHKENAVVDNYIYADGFFSVASYNPDTKEFVGTYGGKFAIKDGKLTETIEFDTKTPERIGTDVIHSFSMGKGSKSMKLDGIEMTRQDDGKPGELAGAWLITGRVNDKGEVRRSTPGARRTMKILSGTRFQWIAYNVETKEFFGTGGGTYTTINGKYTENITFFSRDSSRVGASLVFDYSFTNGEWNHQGKSSKGDPLHEIWTRREKVGI